ncbi:MAG TPA: hypothetical protein VH112_08550 [Acidimicrobiales bacterium]|jgi:hypothetical protein|nr:hypothetical protein [Acidimicrobiales bacterium]
MADSTRALISAILAFSTLLATAALWRHPLALIVLVLSVGLGIFLLRPTRPSLIVYAVGFVFGPTAEVLGIHAGAWRYSTGDFLGIPVWLPFVWGNAALFIQNTGEVATSLFSPNRRREALPRDPSEQREDEHQPA